MIAGPFTATVPAGGTGVTLETPQIEGLVMEVGLNVVFSGGSSMNVTIATKGNSSLAKTLLAVTGINADAWYQPRVQLHGTNGSALSGQYAPLSISDVLVITVASAGAGDRLDVWLELA